jgi:hypothetical protein
MDVQALSLLFQMRSWTDVPFVRNNSFAKLQKPSWALSGVGLGALWLAKSCAACLPRNTLKQLRRMSLENHAYIAQAFGLLASRRGDAASL